MAKKQTVLDRLVNAWKEEGADDRKAFLLAVEMQGKLDRLVEAELRRGRPVGSKNKAATVAAEA